MELSDLPPELLLRIVGFLVGEVGPLYAADYRLVCSMCRADLNHQNESSHM